jgi:hypothetical protein
MSQIFDFTIGLQNQLRLAFRAASRDKSGGANERPLLSN